jgi:polyisoprenoid-binding protein YceI
VAVTAQHRLARHRSLLATLLLLALGMAVAVAAEIDPTATRIGFTLQTRWGQSLQGYFPDPRGEVSELPDGRHQVHLQLKTATVQIVGHPSYTRFTRGSGFFDAAEYPRVEFLSDAYAPALLRDGGELKGMLTIRDIRHREVFTISPGACDAPARDCDVVASGTIHRGDYGMGRWNVALSDRVRFVLRVRVRGPGG